MPLAYEQLCATRRVIRPGYSGEVSRKPRPNHARLSGFVDPYHRVRIEVVERLECHGAAQDGDDATLARNDGVEDLRVGPIVDGRSSGQQRRFAVGFTDQAVECAREFPLAGRYPDDAVLLRPRRVEVVWPRRHRSAHELGNGALASGTSRVMWSRWRSIATHRWSTGSMSITRSGGT